MSAVPSAECMSEQCMYLLYCDSLSIVPPLEIISNFSSRDFNQMETNLSSVKCAKPLSVLLQADNESKIMRKGERGS